VRRRRRRRGPLLLRSIAGQSLTPRGRRQRVAGQLEGVEEGTGSRRDMKGGEDKKKRARERNRSQWLAACTKTRHPSLTGWVKREFILYTYFTVHWVMERKYIKNISCRRNPREGKLQCRVSKETNYNATSIKKLRRSVWCVNHSRRASEAAYIKQDTRTPSKLQNANKQ
jgi:hypothetical protein